ncbi:MAG: asparagine synthetase B family protein, partial [Blastocatellia bacterium]
RARVGELLRESVSMHLVSDVPVAAFLSGGIDSSAVAVLMREAGQTPRTFSIVFSESAYDEAKYARRIAEQIQAEHTEIHLKEEDLLARLPEALGSMDQPTGDGVNTYIVSRAVRDAGVKVALSGLGGDEIFAGYSSFARLDRAAPYLRMLGTVPEGGRAIAARAVRALGGATIAAAKTAAILETDGSISSVFPTLRQVLSVPQRRALLTDRLRLQGDAAPDPYVALLQRALTKTDAGVLTQVSYAESMTYMHDVLLRDTDQMSMAHALEVRVPLLDHKLIEYVMGVPDSLKRSNGTPKRLLVESLGALLPPEIVHRPKRGFTLPFDVWMRGAMRQFCEQRLDRDRTRGRGIFDPNEVWRLWTAFLDGSRSVSWSRLWILIVLEEWLDTNGISSSLARQRVEREDENG